MSKIIHPLTEISFLAEASAVAIEASAGTGKTWTIERLFIKALLEKGVQANLNVKNILVVTFTKVAAAELKARILQQLKNTIQLLILSKNNKLGPCEDPFIDAFILKRNPNTTTSDIMLLTRAMQLFDQASIFTIHGFCQKVIKDYPLECKVSLPFDVATDNQEIIINLLHSFYRDKIINNPFFAANLPLVISNLESLFKADYSSTIIEKIYNKLPKDLLDIKNNQFQLKYISDSYPLDIFMEPKVAASVGLKALISHASQYLLENYPKFHRLSNKISFDELIQLVADALENSPAFATKLYKMFPVAFIDEFQDTDIKQWTIFSQIYQLTTSKRGNVVVVGDPKQAIYRFRGADIDTYIHAVHKEICHTKTLAQNRRSHPHIMNFINQLFAANNLPQYPDLLGADILCQPVEACVIKEQLLKIPSASQLQQLALSQGVEVDFHDAEVQIVSINPACYEQNNGEDYVLNAMTLEILGLLRVQPDLKGKIAILVTRNQEASKIVNFMRKFGIKSSELMLKSVFSTSTAQELLNILKSIADLSNANNFNLSISGRIFNFELNKLLDKEKYLTEFEALYANFYKYQRLFNTNGIMPLIYEIIADSAQLETRISPRELANFFQLGELLHKNSHNFANNYELIHWYSSKIATADQIQDNDVVGWENEELIRLDNDEDQIVITTQHKSKGLEFDILFCPYFKSEDKYFKKDGEIDGMYLKNRLPRYVTEQNAGKIKNSMVIDNSNAQLSKIAQADNAEIQRLNYVSITRAKSRLYIYLTPTKLNAKKTAYYHMSKTAAIHKLFGFNHADINDNQHNLFDYSAIFNNPSQALKRADVLPGVAIYQRNISRWQLKPLGLSEEQRIKQESQPLNLINAKQFTRTIFEQSYSSIVRSSIAHEREHYVLEDLITVDTSDKFTLKYRYNILGGAIDRANQSISGAKFGLLYHELCENYPLDEVKLNKILQEHSVPNEYAIDCHNMINELFASEILPENGTLAKIHAAGNYQAEFEFYLLINSRVDFLPAVTAILAKYYGSDHPYTLACATLDGINLGFLTGFIDLLFEYQGKFWVLDYKTNTLETYFVDKDTSVAENILLQTMAQHHYYLQFILYLVATKRHLESVYNLSDASELLGGAIYLFVRGFYLQDHTRSGGVLVDEKCIEVVKEIDLLLGKQNG